VQSRSNSERSPAGIFPRGKRPVLTTARQIAEDRLRQENAPTAVYADNLRL
jgi:hypothetical protein